MRSIALKYVFNPLAICFNIAFATTKFTAVMIPIYFITCLYAIFIALVGVAECGSTAEPDKRISHALGQDLTRHIGHLIAWTGIDSFNGTSTTK